MKTPDVSKMVHAIFLESFRPDFHSIGTGIVIKYKSVVALSARFDQMICIESAGWQTAEKDFGQQYSSISSRRYPLTAWVWVYLPVFMEWTTGEEYDPEKGDKCGSKQNKANKYLFSITFGQASLDTVISKS